MQYTQFAYSLFKMHILKVFRKSTYFAISAIINAHLLVYRVGPKLKYAFYTRNVYFTQAICKMLIILRLDINFPMVFLLL
jgi:hypothetical protein